MNNYFIDVIEELDIEPFSGTEEEPVNSSNKIDNKIDSIVHKYKEHPSILKIKQHVCITEKFLFKRTTIEQFKKEISLLNIKKAPVDNDIPTKMLIETNDICNKYITNIYNNSIEDQLFPDSLKQADCKPLHKKLATTDKENYRPVSLLPIISKIYERDMFNQILNYIEK